MASILCKGGRLFDGERFLTADLLIKEGRIARIEEDIRETADILYDASGMTICPGLVDAHVHMGGISYERFAISADLSTIPFGVTAAVDASGCRGSKEILDAFTVKNAVLLCGSIRENRADFSEAEQMAPLYREKAIGLKCYFDRYVSPVEDETPLCEMVSYADRHKLLVMVHSSNSPIPMTKLVSVLRAGDILSHAYHGGVHHVAEEDYASLRDAKRRGVFIDAALAGHVHTDFAIFRGAIEAGLAPDIISSDITKVSAYMRGGRYGLPMCMSIAKHLGMREDDVLRAVTSTPARALGKGDEWGSLQVGRCADIAVLSEQNDGFDLTDAAGNRIVSKKGYRNVLTIINGQIVFRD